MEKQTKILIGLAAAGVVAYLVLKPKKAVASTSVSQELTKIAEELSLGLVRCGDGTMQKKEDCATRGGYNTGVMAPRINEEWAPLPNNAPIPKGPCVCITAPCNC
jgi:hypothetical protein